MYLALVALLVVGSILAPTVIGPALFTVGIVSWFYKIPQHITKGTDDERLARILHHSLMGTMVVTGAIHGNFFIVAWALLSMIHFNLIQRVKP